MKKDSYIWELAKLGGPPPGPVVFDSNFCSHHFIEKSGVFLNARRFCYAKITFLSDEMTCTGSGKFFKRKFMVLGPVLAYFSYTNQGQWDQTGGGAQFCQVTYMSPCKFKHPPPYRYTRDHYQKLPRSAHPGKMWFLEPLDLPISKNRPFSK